MYYESSHWAAQVCRIKECRLTVIGSWPNYYTVVNRAITMLKPDFCYTIQNDYMYSVLLSGSLNLDLF